MFADLQPTRLLFSHFGPVSHVEEILERSAEELRRWVEVVGEARASRLDLDHAVAMVRDRTKDAYAALYARDDLDEKFEELSSARANVVGIDRWLRARDGDDYTMGDAAASRPA
jgi:hypothetical protein